MNKKALVLNAIIGLLIALGLIFFVLKVSSDIFRLSDQAKNGFIDLTEWVKEVQASPNPNEMKKEFFYLDKKTYVYPINNISRNMHITKDPIFGGDVDFTLVAPAQCQEVNCLCLCREYKDETDRTCQEVMCEPLPGIEFSPGTGIILDRGDKGIGFFKGEEGPRRQEVTIIKCVAGQSYCKKSKDGDISIIFSWPDEVYDIYGKSGAK
jgi:hypothetical protein